MHPLFKREAQIPAPKDGGRSGVANSDTLEESDSQATFAGDLTSKLLGDILQVLRSTSLATLPTPNRIFHDRYLAATGEPICRSEGITLDCRTIFGGVPAIACTFMSEGAVTGLQIRFNGQGWIGPPAGTITNSVGTYGFGVIMETISFRVVTPGTGVVQLLLRAYDDSVIRLPLK